MKEDCKQDICKAFWISRILPELFNFSDLLDHICDRYGTEVTADCLMEMGMNKEVA